ncbi:MAG: hypothetical protein HYS22_02745 [Deltaproteobacteria bacterium]|nr:hypothetical protein [Deltaproteobacteria bacterium]
MRLRSLLFFAIFLGVASCSKDPMGELYGVSFEETALCGENTKEIPFRNENLEETLHIIGIAIEPGTDPDGNFKLESIKVGSDPEIVSKSGKIDDVSVPPGSPYVVKVVYSPIKEGAGQQAILAIAIDGPDQGIVQVMLTGSEGGAGLCTSESASGPVNFDGEQTLQVTRLVSVTQKLPNDPLTSDPEVTARPFQPVDLNINFNLKGGNFTFPKITEEDSFVLPPTLNPNVKNLIPGDTIITSDAGATGAYTASTGFLEVKDIIIKMRETGGAFQADLKITLTTGGLPLPIVFSQGNLLNADMNLVNGQLTGKPLQVDESDKTKGSVILVGFGTFSNVSGNNQSIVKSLPNSQIGVQIEARIVGK